MNSKETSKSGIETYAQLKLAQNRKANAKTKDARGILRQPNTHDW